MNKLSAIQSFLSSSILTISEFYSIGFCKNYSHTGNRSASLSAMGLLIQTALIALFWFIHALPFLLLPVAVMVADVLIGLFQTQQETINATAMCSPAYAGEHMAIDRQLYLTGRFAASSFAGTLYCAGTR